MLGGNALPISFSKENMKKIPKPKQTEEERLMYRFLVAIVDNLKALKPGAFMLDVETQKVVYDYFVRHGFDTTSFQAKETVNPLQRRLL